MSLYDDSDPRHLAYLGRYDDVMARYTLSRRGEAGCCAGCGWVRAAQKPCRNAACPGAPAPKIGDMDGKALRMVARLNGGTT